MLALALYTLSARLVSSRPLRAVVAFLGAQPALLFAYSLWSGIKELAAAALIALVCAAVAATIGRWQSLRATVPAAVAVAALFAVLSPAGGVWLVVPTLVVVAVLTRRGLSSFVRVAAALVGLIAVLSIPSISIAHSFFKSASGGELTSSTEVANLGHPLDSLQAFGIWPATDFRSSPHDSTLTNVLIGVLLLAVVASLLFAWRRRAWAMPLYLVTAGGGILLLFALDHVGLSSPWLNAKGMAEGSPALVAAAVAGAAALFETGRRTEAAVIGAAIAVGVLWSNGLAYSNVWLAPRGQLAELESIGHRFAGQGPTLMTDPQYYGVRHFLRRMDPEGASDRRRRLVPLLDGQPLDRGTYADLDQFRLDGILVYKTLVLPHSPVESRPPSPYRLVAERPLLRRLAAARHLSDDSRAPSARRLAPAGSRASLQRRASPRAACRPGWAPGRRTSLARHRRDALVGSIPGHLVRRRERPPLPTRLGRPRGHRGRRSPRRVRPVGRRFVP